MKCSIRPSRRRARSALVLAAAIWVGATPGCVTRGTHDAVVAERDSLQDRLRVAERSNASLSAERVKVFEQLEDLREERERLGTEVAQLERTRKELSRSLSKSQKELAARQLEIERTRSTYDGLVSDLESQVAAGEIEIEQLREGLRLNLSQQILFPPGSARLGPAGRDVIGTVAARLARLENRVEVQGHTDDVPISGALAKRYPSNWELAAARASEVVRLLAERGVDPRRLTAISHGEFHPVAPNDSPEGRARNRRIEIRLLPEDGPAGGGPAAPTTPASPGEE